MTFSKIFFASALTTLVLVACSNGKEGDSASTDMATDQTSVSDDHAHDHSHGDTSSTGRDEFKKPEGLYLDQGKKWQVNAEMRPHITGAERWLDEQLVEGNMDPVSLAQGLKKYNDELIQSCTMQGESHEVLHKWLHPHMALIDDLSKTKGKEPTEKAVAAVMRSFAVYHRYFE